MHKNFEIMEVQESGPLMPNRILAVLNPHTFIAETPVPGVVKE